MEGPFVTILFSARALSRASLRLGDDAADAARREHFGLLRAAIAAHGGREVRSTADGLMVAFDSAVAAVRCAVEMQRALRSAGEERVLSIGLAAGEPIRDGDELYGTPVLVGERLREAAAPGQILASDVVRQVVGARVDVPMAPAPSLRLAELEERVRAAEVLWDDDAPSAAPDPAPAPGRISVVVADDERLLRAGFGVNVKVQAFAKDDVAPKSRTRVSLGDRLITRQSLFDAAGKRVGTLHTDCTGTGPAGPLPSAGLLCMTAYTFSSGQIVAAGAFKLDGGEMPIVAGTGAFAGARGT